ncbi:DUF4113 domain-containing protein [Thiomonas sp. X19]
MDAVHARWVRGTLRPRATGTAENCCMKRERQSSRSTACGEALAVVKAG